MKKSVIVLTVLLILCIAGQAWGQKRLPQIELFAGGAIPLSPDGFKDFYKTGFSVHGQYVIFPTPQLGISFGAAYELFTFDNNAYKSYVESGFSSLYGGSFDLDNLNYDTKGSASLIELGIGIRPYLTPPTSNFQFFLFGMGTFSIFTSKVEETYDFYYDDGVTVWHIVGDTTYEADNSKIGFAAGAGLEVPAGSINIIVQGLVRFIPAVETLKYQLDDSWGLPLGEKEESYSFVGLTVGLVF